MLKEFADQFFDIQYHSCMNNFESVVWEYIVVQTTLCDILSIPERAKSAAEAAGVISYGSDVRSGAARAEFIGIVMAADNHNLVQHGERNLVQHGERDLVQHVERDLVQHGERDLVQHSERDHMRAPRMELSAGHIQQCQYDRTFGYEYQNRGHAIRITNDNTGAVHRRLITLM